jgi:hypothetical protein
MMYTKPSVDLHRVWDLGNVLQRIVIARQIEASSGKKITGVAFSRGVTITRLPDGGGVARR